MMDAFLEDAQNALHHRAASKENGGSCSCSETDSEDDPFLYDKFLPDPDWAQRDKEERADEPKNSVDPGYFRYNKRVFVTSFPALLLVLALGGDMLLFMTVVGTGVLTIMSQFGDSRRCVVAFVVIFIPIHTYVLASVIPFLWLSGWHIVFVVLVNVYLVCMGGWSLLQFKAFRTEEPQLATVIEQILFTLHPLVCTSILCWSLAAVISLNFIPIILAMSWFVLLQLYLVPTLSSFRLEQTADENFDVVQVPVVVLSVVAFILLPPLVHLAISIFAFIGHFSTALYFIHFMFTLALSLFLSTLLSIRQIFEYLGLSWHTAIYVRWTSGLVCTAICYPVLRDYGLVSHFLPFLPMAIAIFAALGLLLSFRKRRLVVLVLCAVLIASLTSLFFLWIQGMPHHLDHYFLGVLPINMLYILVCCNFVLCVLCMWTASLDGAHAWLALLLILQALALAVCEISLYNSGLYSSSLLQLSGLSASYTLFRLKLADKISRQAAIFSSAIHLAKCLSNITSIVLDAGRARIGGVEMVVLTYMALTLLTVFVYGTLEEPTGQKVLGQVLLLLSALAISSYHFLLPLNIIIFGSSASFTYVIGLWCLVGGGLLLLFRQTTPPAYSSQVFKLTIGLSLLGALILLLHPRLGLTFYSVFQWIEIVSVFTAASLLTIRYQLSPMIVLSLALVLSICPGIRASIFFWGSINMPTVCLCVVAANAILVNLIALVVVPVMSESLVNTSHYSTLGGVAACVVLLVNDFISTSFPLTQLPAWPAVLFYLLAFSVTVKLILSYKKLENLPLTSKEEQTSMLVQLKSTPVLCNTLTISTFFVACVQGPFDSFYHDLWCCLATVVLGCLHSDGRVMPKLSGDRRAAPTVVISCFVLVLSSLLQSRMWTASNVFTRFGGLVELVLILLTMPVFVNIATVLWGGRACSEPLVVFTTPYAVLLLLNSSSYTAWLLSLVAVISGSYMMLYRLPMVPYKTDPDGYYR